MDVQACDCWQETALHNRASHDPTDPASFTTCAHGCHHACVFASFTEAPRLPVVFTRACECSGSVLSTVLGKHAMRH
eukprot:9430254-Alexandrium_andersonii.AAC.1